MNSGGTSWTAVTAVVFCAVSATIALMPWQPRRANAFRSAWMPAPPPESEPAIVRQRGSRVHRWLRLPSASVATASAPGTSFSPERSSRISPRCPRASGAGPAAGRRLHPRVRDALAGAESTASTATRPRPSRRAREASTWSSRPAPRAARRSRSTCPCSNALAAEPKLRALYLYPTKALAQDQARALAALKVPRLRAAIYDGDTEPERRWQIRKWANVILTNPDMLHVGVLPHHDRWGDVLQNLRYVVVDEAHVYRGVFGSHVANVLRRLRRGAADLRRRAAVPARLGDDREPRRARRAR